MIRTVWVVKSTSGKELGTLRATFEAPDPDKGKTGENLTNTKINDDGSMTIGQMVVDHDTGFVTVPWDDFLVGYDGYEPR